MDVGTEGWWLFLRNATRGDKQFYLDGIPSIIQRMPGEEVLWIQGPRREVRADASRLQGLLKSHLARPRKPRQEESTTCHLAPVIRQHCPFSRDGDQRGDASIWTAAALLSDALNVGPDAHLAQQPILKGPLQGGEIFPVSPEHCAASFSSRSPWKASQSQACALTLY